MSESFPKIRKCACGGKGKLICVGLSFNAANSEISKSFCIECSKCGKRMPSLESKALTAWARIKNDGTVQYSQIEIRDGINEWNYIQNDEKSVLGVLEELKRGN